MQRHKSATRAYRLDSSLIEGLKRVAMREGVSENSFVEDLLTKRVKTDPLIHAFPYVVLSRRTLIPILSSTNRDVLEMAGLDLGKRNFTLARELYESAGGKLGFVEYLSEILDKDAHWFEVEGLENRPERLTLQHECGMKWSHFLRTYLTSAFELASREKPKMTLNDSYVSLELPAKQQW